MEEGQEGPECRAISPPPGYHDDVSDSRNEKQVVEVGPPPGFESGPVAAVKATDEGGGWDDAEVLRRERLRREAARDERQGVRGPGLKYDFLASRKGDAPLALERTAGKRKMVAKIEDAGFCCAICDGMSFRDSSAYLDHLNTLQHLRRAGMSNKVKRSSLADVKTKILELAAKANAPGAKKDVKPITMDSYEEARMAHEERAREERRAKRRKKVVPAPKVVAADGKGAGGKNDDEEEDIFAAMGFAGFGGSR